MSTEKQIDFDGLNKSANHLLGATVAFGELKDTLIAIVDWHRQFCAEYENYDHISRLSPILDGMLEPMKRADNELDQAIDLLIKSAKLNPLKLPTGEK